MRKGATDRAFDEYVALVVQAALVEDVGEADVTTKAIVGSKAVGEAVIIVKEACVPAGLFVAGRVFENVSRKLKFVIKAGDGRPVKKGAVLAHISGPLGAMLTAERVALNFLQRLSGIATLTDAYVRKAGKRAAIYDTRKTTPLLRPLERYAVRAGGGNNHRLGLFDAVLIKDNHIKAAGSVSAALTAARKRYRGTGFVEVEVTNLSEAVEAASFAPDIIMLDNMDIKTIKKAAALIGRASQVEVSGGVTLATVGAIAACGVDRISVGGLTHSAPSIDISMEVVSVCRQKTRRRFA